MKTKSALPVILAILSLLSCLTARAATVTFTLTNSLGVADTNLVRVWPVGSPILADGTVITKGTPIVLRPNASGIVTTNFSAGHYLASNQWLVVNFGIPGGIGSSKGVVFAVPNTSLTYTLPQLAVSGYNTYNYSGTTDGSLISNGTINSNAFDAATIALMAGGIVTNVSWGNGTNLLFDASVAGEIVQYGISQQYGVGALIRQSAFTNDPYTYLDDQAGTPRVFYDPVGTYLKGPNGYNGITVTDSEASGNFVGNGVGLTNLVLTPWTTDINSGGYNLLTPGGVMIGISNAFDATIPETSSNLFVIGTSNLVSAEVKRSSDIYVVGKNIFGGAEILDSSLILAQGAGVGPGITLTNSSRVILRGNEAGSNSIIGGSVRVSIDGNQSLYNSDVRDSADLHLLGNLSAYNSSIRNSTNLFLLGSQAFYLSTISNSQYFYGLGPGALAVANWTNCYDVMAIGLGAGYLNSGSYTQLTLIGSWASGTNSFMMDFGSGYTNGYRFRGPVYSTDTFSGNGSGLTNLWVNNANITNAASVLLPSAQTNYLVTVYPNGKKYYIYTANTNVDLIFLAPPGLVSMAGCGASLWVSAVTSSVNARVTIPSNLLTNANLNLWVTNGYGQWLNFESIDGSTTNITVTGSGLYHR